jgi:hypothetical protein
MKTNIVSKVIIFGAGKQGEKYMREYGSNIEILAFADNFRGGGVIVCVMDIRLSFLV